MPPLKTKKKGFKKLIGWLKKHGVEVDDLHICMEATNVYWEDLCLLGRPRFIPSLKRLQG